MAADDHFQPGHLIRRNHQRAMALFSEELRETDFTPVQFQILSTVDDYPGIDQISLSTIAGIDKSTITELVVRLEDRGLLRRELGVIDQRSKAIFLTDKGRKYLVSIKPLVATAQKRIIEPLNATERVALIYLLRKLVGLAETEADAPPVAIKHQGNASVHPRRR